MESYTASPMTKNHGVSSLLDGYSHDMGVNADGLIQYLKESNLEVNEHELNNLITVLDRNHDGTIDYNEVKYVFGSITNENELIKKMKLLSLFNKLDSDLSGDISTSEWSNIFFQMKYNRNEFCESNGITDMSIIECVDDVSDNEIDLLFNSIDYDHSGNIDFNEFYKLFKDSNSMRDMIKTAKLRVIFNQIDNDLSGSLDPSEIYSAFISQGFNLNRYEIKELIEIVDENNDGQIDFEEFKHAFDNIDSLKNVVNQWKSMVVADIGNDLSYSHYIHQSDSDHNDSNDQSSKQSLFSINKRFLAGGTGGIFARTLTAPLERIKIISQANFSSQYKNIRSIYHEIIQAQGYRGLFQGNFINCLRVFPFGGCVTFTYNLVLDTILKYDDSVSNRSEISDGYRFIAGAIAGSIATTITYPLDVIRTHVSVNLESQSISAELLKMNTLFRGLSPTLLAMSTMVGIQNTTYDECINIATKKFDFDPTVPLFLTCGTFAGLAAQSIVYPLDVIRRQIQLHGHELETTINFNHKEPQSQPLSQTQTKQIPQQPVSQTHSHSHSHSQSHTQNIQTQLQRQAMPKNVGLAGYGVGNPMNSSMTHSVKQGMNVAMNRVFPTFAKQSINLVQKQGVRPLYNGLLATYLKTVPSMAISMSVRDVILGKHKMSKKD